MIVWTRRLVVFTFFHYCELAAEYSWNCVYSPNMQPNSCGRCQHDLLCSICTVDVPALFFVALCFLNKIHYLSVHIEYDTNTLICPLASTRIPNSVAFLISRRFLLSSYLCFSLAIHLQSIRENLWEGDNWGRYLIAIISGCTRIPLKSMFQDHS